MKKRFIGFLLAFAVAGGTMAGAEEAVIEEYIPQQVYTESDSEQTDSTEQEDTEQADIEEYIPADTDDEAYDIDIGEDVGIHLALNFASQIPVMKSVEGTADKVTISWLAVSGADRYNIYRQKVGTTGWDNIGSSKTTSYTDNTASGTVSYYYAVRAIKGGANDYIRSERSESYLRVGRPVLIMAEESSEGVKIWWKETAGNKKYYVYRRKKGAVNWRELTTITASNYEDKSAKMGHSYEYTVRASCVNRGVEFQSGRSTEGVGATRQMTVPNVTSIDGTENRVTLKWEKVSGADSYYIFRMESGGKWGQIGSTTDKSYTDSTAKEEKSYRYRVRAGRKMYDGSIAMGGYQNPGIQRPGKTKLTSAESEQRGIRVRWEAVSGVKEYRVYRKDSLDSKWEFLGTTKHKYYLDQNVKFKSYYYTVRAVGLNPKTFYGGFEKNGIEGKYTYGIVQMSLLKNMTAGIQVNWNRLSGATGYQVYRKAGKETSWSRIATVNSGSTVKYTDKNVKSGTKYSYTIRSVRNGTPNAGYDATGMSVYRLDSPEMSEVTRGKESLNVSWKKVNGADSYEVYRSVNGSEWEKYADTKGTSYQDKEVVNGRLYMYSARAKHGESLSGYNQKGIGRVYLKAVDITYVSLSNGSVVVKWSSNSQADRYVLSYSASEKFSKDTRISVEGTSATIKNLSKGEIYYLRVNALKEAGGQKHFSLWSDTSMVAIEE